MMFCLSYILAFYTMGLKSWIKQDNVDKYTFCILDHSSRTTSYLPLEHITEIESCHYSLFKTQTPNPYKNKEFHHVFKQFGYCGKGLIICYQLPKHISGDSLTRSWQIPSPKADLFIDFIRRKS